MEVPQRLATSRTRSIPHVLASPATRRMSSSPSLIQSFAASAALVAGEDAAMGPNADGGKVMPSRAAATLNGTNPSARDIRPPVFAGQAVGMPCSSRMDATRIGVHGLPWRVRRPCDVNAAAT